MLRQSRRYFYNWMDTERLRRQNLALLAKLQDGQLLMKNWLNSSLQQNSASMKAHFTNVGHSYNKPGESMGETSYVNACEKTPVKVRFVDRVNNSSSQSVHLSDTSDASVEILEARDMISPLRDTAKESMYSSPIVSPSRRTPKSVIKRRHIIDRNIKLDSELGDWDFVQPKSRLQWLEMLNTGHSDRTDETDISHLYYSSGNKRPDKISTRTALHPFPCEDSDGSKPQRSQELNMPPLTSKLSNSKDFSSNTSKSIDSSNWRTDTNDIIRGDTERPLLGYDWIAANLDNSHNLSELSDSFLEDIKQFRRRNKSHCEDRYGTESTFNWLAKSAKSPPVVKKLSHTCVHGYVLNNRLYPEPINSDEEGNSVCPVCLVERQKPTPESPGYVRISIPKNALVSPYAVKPHRRKSFDCADAVSLSSHCMVGWESSKPSALPPASTMDLREAVDGITEKLVTEIDAEKNIINSLESMGKRLTSYHGREKALDMHRSLLYELESQIRDDK